MILCVGVAADDTLRHTIAAIAACGARIDVVDLAQLAHSGAIAVSCNALDDTTVELHGKRHCLRDYGAAFVRLHDISAAAPTSRLSSRSAAIYRTLSRVFTHASLPVINPPLLDRSNFSKVFHAAELVAIAGWRTPRSCLTNDAATARSFVASCPGGAIFKGASGAKTWATRYDEVEHASRLELLRACPVLFQECIDGPDVRLHAVGDSLFGELIVSATLDYRTVRGNEFHPLEDLSTEIRTGALALQRATGCPFLGIDFKIDRATGEWFFLEANPMPGYDGYDRRAGGAISSALASWLCERSSRS